MNSMINVAVNAAMKSTVATDALSNPAAVSDGAHLLTLDESLSLLASPDTQRPLRQEGARLLAEGECFEIRDGVALLVPSRLQPYLAKDGIRVPPDYGNDALLQYARISAIKQNGGDANSDHNDVWYRRHVEWSRELLRDASGDVLDIGCDSPRLSATFFPAECRYLGVDPLYASNDEFRLGAMAEFLPVRDASFDGVCFLTSLDHVFDYKRALAEASRVLKSGGQIYLASLVWTDRCDLHYDLVHFHHFRESQLFDELGEFSVEEVRRYDWKNDSHRTILYLRGTKA